MSDTTSELEKHLYSRLLKTCEHFEVGKFTGCGTCLSELRTYHSDQKQRWEVAARKDELNKLIPHTERWPWKADDRIKGLTMRDWIPIEVVDTRIAELGKE